MCDQQEQDQICAAWNEDGNERRVHYSQSKQPHSSEMEEPSQCEAVSAMVNRFLHCGEK